jgi:uncharacterized membrane protein YbjE (DUF340 family)
MKKISGDKSVGVIMLIFMEVLQGNSLCSYLNLKQANVSCFLFCLFSFSSIKLENRRAEQAGGLVPRQGTVQKMCIHVSKCINDTF